MIYHATDNQIIRHTHTERTRAPCNTPYSFKAVIEAMANY